MTVRTLRLVLVLVILSRLSVLGQVAAGPVFEVASVKPNRSGNPQAVRLDFQPGGQFTAINVHLRALIALAYITERPMFPQIQIVGPPSIDSEKYDVIAKTAGDYKAGTDRLLIRNLLADRFKLTAHVETRPTPVYVLVVANSNGSLGPRISRSDIDCAAASGRGDLPGPPPPVCQPSVALGLVRGNALTMLQLAGQLSRYVGGIVMDRTGLSGVFKIDLEFTPDQAPAGVNENPSAAVTGPSVFTAVQEQLGLKLESRREPIEVIVIDHVERPTPD